jgi:hypothetical protein
MTLLRNVEAMTNDRPNGTSGWLYYPLCLRVIFSYSAYRTIDSIRLEPTHRCILLHMFCQTADTVLKEIVSKVRSTAHMPGKVKLSVGNGFGQARELARVRDIQSW